MERFEFAAQGILGLRAANPGPFTLSGTNSWIVGGSPAFIVDPGPALDAHLAALVRELEVRGGLGGIALTHDHADHAEAVPHLRARYPEAKLAAARGAVDVPLEDGAQFGPLEVLATPGHAPDHLAFLSGRVAFTGDAVLGTGSVFLWPDPGALAGYLRGLDRLRSLQPELLLPGHGPPVLNPRTKLDEYIAHREDRERALLRALERGGRTVEALLDDAWGDAPEQLRPAAAVTLAAHLDKLEAEGRLPPGVERPALPAW